MKPTTEQIIQFAEKAGVHDGGVANWVAGNRWEEALAIAYAAGAAAMKERAAKVCEEIAAYYSTDIFPEDGTSIDCNSAKMGRVVTKNCAQSIRALGGDDE